MQKPTQQQVFSITSAPQFESLALKVFKYQSTHCDIYQSFIKGLGIELKAVKSIYQIPFLPVEFFKNFTILSDDQPAEVTFTSSGTTGMITSSHYVTDASWYRQSFRKAFGHFYGNIKDYCVLALLPAYLEREGSSLIYMAQDFIDQSQHPDSGFYLYNHEDLYAQLLKNKRSGQPTLLLGVTFALLDFAEKYQLNFPELIVMETGGMKGRRKELIREELHNVLTSAFGVKYIHSEYGMTELLSQAYSKGDGIFNCPPWMKIITRDTNDPLTLYDTTNRTGGINIIDLANINSCSFIATQDLGKVFDNGCFEILGRFDNADIRGCNLLIA